MVWSAAVIAALLAGCVAGLAIALPVGAIGTYLVGLATRVPWPVAVSAAFGVASADGLYAIVAAAAGLSLQRPLQAAGPWLTWLASGTLVALSLRTAMASFARYRAGQVPDQAVRTPRMAAARTYLAMTGLTAVNPATIGYFIALMLGRQATDAGLAGAAVALFALGAFVGSAAWQLLLVGAGSLLGRVLAGRRAQLGLGLCSSAIMVGLAGELALR